MTDSILLQQAEEKLKDVSFRFEKYNPRFGILILIGVLSSWTLIGPVACIIVGMIRYTEKQSLEKELFAVRKEYSDLKRTIYLKNELKNESNSQIKIRCSCNAFINEGNKFCDNCGKEQVIKTKEKTTETIKDV